MLQWLLHARAAETLGPTLEMGILYRHGRLQQPSIVGGETETETAHILHADRDRYGAEKDTGRHSRAVRLGDTTTAPLKRVGGCPQ